ncbi:alpha/beta fold hydrolase [Actinoplanes sp. Pm04-4]|uniref:Alpha/beta fold hydrolase n=1 Tax=Paractinoplanes pyxinae TaxID=2997416 RepID=A0ABT4BB41_9ACTN|nr:alpha/beta hydrolase [Actinoplanes pyxinae]MCY1142828.1 alpha/beta fold hydrolase [Actinoplanes pyxinae]
MTTFPSRWTLGLHDRSHEEAPGLPVVMLHGLAVSHRYLLPVARALADRHPVVLPDLPGFGRSGKPARAYDVGEHAEVLVAWLAARGLGRVALVGHSFGAEVAARLAVLVPETVAALVLASPTCDPSGRTRRALIGRWLLDTQVEAPWQAPILARDVLDAKPWRVLATVGHSVRNAVEDDLVKLSVRPLVLAGALDPVAPARWRAEVAALTGGTMVTLPQAAHNVLTTSPRRSADAIAAHLRTV